MKAKTYSPVEAAIELELTLNYVYTLLRTGKVDGADRHDGRWIIPAKWVETRKAKVSSGASS